MVKTQYTSTDFFHTSFVPFIFSFLFCYGFWSFDHSGFYYSSPFYFALFFVFTTNNSIRCCSSLSHTFRDSFLLSFCVVGICVKTVDILDFCMESLGIICLLFSRWKHLTIIKHTCKHTSTLSRFYSFSMLLFSHNFSLTPTLSPST